MEFVRKGFVDCEVIPDKSDVVPNQDIDINEMYLRGVAPPEATNLEYDSDENGENVSFDDASPIIPDKIAALEQLQYLERQYKQAKDEAAAAAAAAEAQKMSAAADTVQVSANQPSEAQA